MKYTIKKLIRYHQIKEWYEKYERVLIPGTLVFGVIADWVTFISINITTAFLLLGVYFCIAGGIIAFQHAYDAGRISQHVSIFRYLRLSAPLVIQFTFGALLSASFIFYLFSGTLSVSWPFIGLLVVLMVSNDVFRRQYLRPMVQLSVFFFILFSLTSIILPFVFNTISVSLFILSGAISVLLMCGYVALLGHAVPDIERIYRRLAIAVATIVACVNGLYFLNVIPPIPLSLRDSAIAHDIERGRGIYTLRVEKQSFLDRLIPGQTFHQDAGRVYVYTAIFAPGDLATTIVHHWQYFDEQKKQWVTKNRLGFGITGGATTGYRGFSSKSSVSPGRWRVDIETRRRQVLGRVRFRVVSTDENTQFATIIK